MTSDAVFRRTVWRFYRLHGRHTLPWRCTADPYAILVSEMMLQQTQVTRVIPKYEAFLTAFPTLATLAAAPLSDVLRLWQGLGYNRRAKYLHQAAKEAVQAYDGALPQNYTALRALPGIGDYTAKAILAFAYNVPNVLIETNVRTVFLHHYFLNQTSIADADILPLILRTLPKKRAREWYAALMDYGAHLKGQYENPSRRSRAHKVQGRFKGSDRQLRGRIMTLCTTTPSGVTLHRCLREWSDVSKERVRALLLRLCSEGLLVQKGVRFLLPT